MCPQLLLVVAWTPCSFIVKVNPAVAPVPVAVIVYALAVGAAAHSILNVPAAIGLPAAGQGVVKEPDVA